MTGSKLARVPLREGYGGALVLRDAAAWFVGRVVLRAGGGDHVGFVLDPVEWGGRDADGDGPLLRLAQSLDIAPGHPVDRPSPGPGGPPSAPRGLRG